MATRPTTSEPAAPAETFADLLAAQVRNEFTASQQYIAIAVWFDDHDLPRWPGTSTGSRSRSATTR